MVWFNGPGIRWLGPKLLEHAIQGAEVDSSLRIKGTLLGGLDIHDLALRSDGAIAQLKIDRLEMDYRFREIIFGKLRGVSGEGIYLNLRLLKKEDDESEPIDFSAIGKSLNKLRDLILPVEVDVKDLRIEVKEDSKLVVSVGESSLRHEAGKEEVVLQLGRVSGPDGETLVEPQAMVLWKRSGLSLPLLDLSTTAGVRDLAVLLPESGGISAKSGIRFGEARLDLHVGEGLKGARLNLLEGSLELEKFFASLGMPPLVLGRLTSISVELDDFYPEWTKVTGLIKASAKDVVFQEYQFSKLQLEAVLGEGKMDVTLSGEGLGSAFTITASGKIERPGSSGNKKSRAHAAGVINALEGRLEIEKVPAVLKELSRILPMKRDFSKFPASQLSGTWKLMMKDGFDSVSADLKLEPSDPDLSAIELDATYKNGGIAVESFAVNGVQAEGEWLFENTQYRASLTAQNFNSKQIAPWLQGSGIQLPGEAGVSLSWQGEGNLSEGTHRGQLDDFSGTWKGRKKGTEATFTEPVKATGNLSYNWPQEAQINELELELGDQKVSLKGALKDQQLELKRFAWNDSEGLLGEGQGSIPFPKDFSNLKDFFATETRPLNLKIESQKVPLRKLRPWVSALEKVGEQATAKLKLSLQGSLNDPDLKAEILVEHIRVGDRDDLPAADVELSLTGRDALLSASAKLRVPDFEPISVTLSMPFNLQKWAQVPESLKQEEIEGRFDLPENNLSKFVGLSDQLQRLDGIFEGSGKISGVLGKPIVDGEFHIRNAALVFKGDKIADLSGVNLSIQGNMAKVSLEGSVRDIEGGSLNFEGNWNLQGDLEEAPDDSLGVLDFRLRGKGLPVVRNDSLILRTDADLSITGPAETASLAGSLSIRDSIFFKDFQLIPINKPLLEPAPPKLPKVDSPSNPVESIPEFLRTWSADVQIKTLNPVLIRGNLGKGLIRASLKVSGPFSDLKPSGVMSLEKTSLELPFTTLKLKQGLVEFTRQGGFDPVIEFRGTASPSSYQVEVYAYGPISDPQLVLTSQPPLPENEIMTLLATGTTTQGLSEEGRAASVLTQLLVEEFRRGRLPFSEQLRPLVQVLDGVEFSISEEDPYSSDSYNSAELELGSKWSVSAGVGDDGDQRFLATWRLRFK